MSSAQVSQKDKDNPQKNAATSKYTTQLQAIRDSYDQPKLADLSNKFSAKQSEEKAEAIAFAVINDIPIRYEREDGSLIEIQFITDDGIPIYYTTYNANAAISTRANYLNTGGGLGLDLNGDDLNAHVWDAGLARTTHQEYDGTGGNNRYSIGDGTSALHYHSAHVAGTIMASGVVASAKGMAWQSNVVGYDWNNDVSEAITAAANGMLISNHSYGWIASDIPDSYFGQYGGDAVNWDNVMFNAPYYLMLVAAGNDGNDNTSNGNPLDGQSGYDKLNGHATAKNNLVVANGTDAIINGDGSLNTVAKNSSSSEGPTDDYRIKPDITGNGTSLYSTFESSNSAYASISGTSMATPNVAGTLLLLQEHYNNLSGNFMKASTLKGIALHTADDISPSGPDAHTGWGLLNAKIAAETITTAAASSGSAIVEELTLTQGQTYQITVQSNGTDPLLASISWTDPAGTVNNSANDHTPALVNDLDVRLDNGTSFTPWKLTGVTTNGTGDNDVDPFERIDINGASGTYTLTVTHKGSLSGGAQDFSLIVTGVVVATTPLISFGSSFNTINEETNCSFTDISTPVNIALAASQDADVTFSINGSSTASNGLDFELLTPLVTFPSGSTTSQNMVLRVYHDGFIESVEDVIIDLTVDAHGGDASADSNADSFTLSINDNDLSPAETQNNSVFFEDFEDSTGWSVIDADGDGQDWVITDKSGIHGYIGKTAISYSWNGVPYSPDNYIISPQFTIPSNVISASVTYEIGSATDPGYYAEHYSVYFTTDISSEATITGGTVLEDDRTIPTMGSETRTHDISSLMGQTGYFVVRHHNVFDEWYLGLDTINVAIVIDTPIQTTVNSGTPYQVPMNGVGTAYTSDPVSGKVMLDITNNNTNDYGCLDVSVSRAGTGAQSYNGSTFPNLVMDKNFNITPTNLVLSGDTSITFYFTEEEIAGWEAATGLSRNILTSGRDIGGTLEETSTLTLSSFGSNVTLTGNYTGLDGTFLFGPATAFVICSGITKTWNGNSWIPGGIPNGSDMVIINGNYNTSTDGNIDACELTINSGKTLIIAANDYVNIYGNINVNGSLQVYHQGSVVQSDADALVVNNGTINVGLETPVLQTRDFMVMGSPMDAETRTGVYNSAFLVLEHIPVNFLPHPEVPAGGTNFADDNGDFWNSFASGPIHVGEGYIVRPQSGYSDPANTTFSMTYSQGTLNNGDIVRPVVYNGPSNPNGTPNVLSNPYASAIDADAFMASNSLGELYFWEHLTPPSQNIPGYGSINFSMGDVSMYNTSGGLPAANDIGGTTAPNGVISTGQGFAVRASAAGSVTFDNTMRLTTGNTTLRRPTNDIDRIWLSVNHAEYGIGSNTLIAFNPDGTPDLDLGYDSDRMATAISLYSHLLDGSEQLSIQTREAFDSTIKIPMGFASQVKADESYSISISEVDGANISLATVYLVDNQEGLIHNLSNGDYGFESEEGTFNQRFTLMFEPEIILGISDNNLDRISLFPNPTNDVINIVSTRATITGVSIYDVMGREVLQQADINNTQCKLDLSMMETAMYFVTVDTNEGSITKQFVKH